MISMLLTTTLKIRNAAVLSVLALHDFLSPPATSIAPGSVHAVSGVVARGDKRTMRGEDATHSIRFNIRMNTMRNLRFPTFERLETLSQ